MLRRENAIELDAKVAGEDEAKVHDTLAALPIPQLPFIAPPMPDPLLLTWETGVKEAVQRFLQRVKREIAIPYQPPSRQPVLISYMPSQAPAQTASQAAMLQRPVERVLAELEYFLTAAGVPVTLMALTGYDLSLMSGDDLKKKVIEFKCTEQDLQYRVIGLNNQEEKATIPWDKLPASFPRTDAEVLANKKELISTILEVTSKAGHTPLTMGAMLAERLATHEVAIVLCTERYVQAAQTDASIPDALEKFAHGKKDALHTLQCVNFQLASTVVSKHYLFRDYQLIINTTPDVLLPLTNFIDLLGKYSGKQGLGLLPDLLDLEHNTQSPARCAYEAIFNELEQTLTDLTLSYRLRKHLEESHAHHTFQPHLQATPLARPLQDTFSRTLQNLLKDPKAKTKVFLCQGQTSAETILTGLALEKALLDELLDESPHVLTIDCKDYPGKKAHHCVAHALRALKLEEPAITALKQKPIIILLKNYEQIGAYDNLYIKNQLADWPQVKIAVTCSAHFFEHLFSDRDYIDYFLSEPDKAQLTNLELIEVPPFASKEAKAASLQQLSAVTASAAALPLAAINTPATLSQAMQETKEEAQNGAQTTTLKSKALQKEFEVFLSTLNHALVQKGLLHPKTGKNPQAFISYAWEPVGEGRTRQHGHLLNIAHHLTALGFPTWLDIERMTGDIDAQMALNIKESRYALLICTPLYTERSEKETNVKKEYSAIEHANVMDAFKNRNRADPLTIFSLQFADDGPTQANGPIYKAFPVVLPKTNRHDFRGIDDTLEYIRRMSEGLIPDLLRSLAPNNLDFEAEYQAYHQAFQEQLALVPAKHLLLERSEADFEALDIEERLTLYIPGRGLLRPTETPDMSFDLNARFEAFIQNPKSKTCVVLGQGGSGKSLFALSTFKAYLQEWKDYRATFSQQSQNEQKALPDYLPIYIPLKNYAGAKASEAIFLALQDYGLEVEDIAALKAGLNHNQKVLFILDGYDELATEVHPNFSQSLADWPHAKLLITGRPEHFKQESEYTDAFALQNAGTSLRASFECYYLSPFSQEEIQRYIAAYESTHQNTPLLTIAARAKNDSADADEKAAPDESKQESKAENQASADSPTYGKLKSLPGLLPLLDNPFLLNLVLNILPRLLANQAQLPKVRPLNRADVYQAFAESCFVKESLSPEEGQAFAEALSVALLTAKTITIAPESPIWKDFFTQPSQARARAACPLRRRGGIYSFIHKSMYEYFVACHLWKALANPSFSERDAWHARSLREEPSIIDFLVDFTKSAGFVAPLAALEAETVDDVVSHQLSLLRRIQASKNNADLARGASNAITVLNHARSSFSGLDLSGVMIPEADLSQSVCGGTDFRGAHLKGVILRGAHLNGAQFQGADLEGVLFGEYPSFLLDAAVEACVYSPDGKQLAVASGKSIKLYDTATQTVVQSLEGHTDRVTSIPYSPDGKRVTSIQYSPDGKRLASGSEDRTVRVWDLERGLCERVLEGHTDGVTSIQYSPDGKMLVSGSGDNTVRVWDLERGLCERALEGRTSTVTSLQYSSDGKTLVSGSGDNTVRVWDLERGLCERVLKGHIAKVTSVQYSPDGKTLASGSLDSTVRVWDLKRGMCERVLEGHTGSMTSIQYSPDGKTLVSGSYDKTVRVWDLERGLCERVLEGHTNTVTSVQYSPDGKTLVSGSRDNTVRVWDLKRGLCERVWEGHTRMVTSIQYSPDGKTLASGSYDHTVHVWDLKRGLCERVLEGHTHVVDSLQYSPDGKTLVSGSRDNTVRVWDLERGLCERVLEGHTSGVTSLQYSSDGKTLVSGSEDNTVRVWDLERGLCERVLKGHTGGVASIQYSPDGKTLVSGSRDNTVRVWDLECGLCERVLKGHTSYVTSLQYSPDGKTLVSGSRDNTVRVWDLERGLCERVLEGHTSYVTSLQYSPDGKTLASGSNDHTVRVWDLKRGMCERVLEGHTGGVASIQYSPDGKTLVSGSWDNTVRVWDFERGYCIAEVSCGTKVFSCQWEPSGKPYLVSSHEDGSVRYWLLREIRKEKGVEEGLLYRLELVWTSKQRALSSTQADFKDTEGLSASNAKLLEQRGGLQVAAMLRREGRDALPALEEKDSSASDAPQTLFSSSRHSSGFAQTVSLPLDQGPTLPADHPVHDDPNSASPAHQREPVLSLDVAGENGGLNEAKMRVTVRRNSLNAMLRSGILGSSSRVASTVVADTTNASLSPVSDTPAPTIEPPENSDGAEPGEDTSRKSLVWV